MTMRSPMKPNVAVIRSHVTTSLFPSFSQGTGGGAAQLHLLLPAMADCQVRKHWRKLPPLFSFPGVPGAPSFHPAASSSAAAGGAERRVREKETTRHREQAREKPREKREQPWALTRFILNNSLLHFSRSTTTTTTNETIQKTKRPPPPPLLYNLGTLNFC